MKNRKKKIVFEVKNVEIKIKKKFKGSPQVDFFDKNFSFDCVNLFFRFKTSKQKKIFSSKKK